MTNSDIQMIRHFYPRINKLIFCITSILFTVILGSVYGWNRLLWLDEVQTAEYIKRGISYILTFGSFNQVTDIHPPFYYLLVTFWSHVFPSDFGLRSFSLFFAICSVVLIYYFTKEISTEKVATVATTLLVFSVPHIMYSVEVRMYSISVFLTLLSSWLLIVWQKTDRRILTIIYSISVLSCLYTYHFLVFLILAQYVYIVLETLKNHSKFRSVLVATTIIIVGYIPGLIKLLYQLKFVVGNDYWGLKPNILELPGLLFWFIAGPFWHGNLPLQILIVSSFLWIFFLGWYYSKISRNIKWFLAIWFWLPPLIVYFLSQHSPLFQPRYFLFTLPVFLIILASEIVFIWELKVRLIKYSLVVGQIITIIFTIYLLLFSNYHIDVKSVIKTIEENHIDLSETVPVFHVVLPSKNYEVYIVSRYYHSKKTSSVYEKILGEYQAIPKEIRALLKASDFTKNIDLKCSKSFWLVIPQGLLTTSNQNNIFMKFIPSGFSLCNKYHFYLVDLLKYCYDNVQTKDK